MDDPDKEDLRRAYCFSRPVFHVYSDKEILMRKPVKWFVFFLGLGLILSLSFSSDCLAADIILNDLESQPANLSVNMGKASILFFWTTWCPYCRSELRALSNMHPKIEKEGITVFAVNLGESENKVKRFLKEYLLNIRVLLDTLGLAGQHYEISGVPTYVFINKDGRVVLTQHTLPDNYMEILSR